MAIVLVISIMAPSIIKLSHAIYEHHTTDCEQKSAIHFHKVDLDCDFQKFKNAPQYVIFNAVWDKVPSLMAQETTNSQYFFLSKFQKLHFVLRGPPSIS